jgi:acyl transferase domain-containing protein/NAD(P)-dependent dehydrogenase (short-subunit alcohol dehydrogenase family)/acyl carrier protein
MHEDALLSDRLSAALDDAVAKLEAVQRAKSEPVAIVGMGCRFPGADNPDAFWRLLRDGVDAIVDVPANRWDAGAIFDADPEAAGKMYVRKGGFLSAVDGFDARFFEISPREARAMDPQQRLLLEVVCEALEDAGTPADALRGSATGVFVGATTNDYGALLMRDGAEALDAYFSTGNALNAGPGRLAHVLGLQGPCLAVDTACSSSLVAVHLACQSLRAGECDIALAGGVSLILAPEVTVAICRARMLAPDGHCKTFDADADGYARGEGCGMVVLKRLSDAVTAGDRVLATIRGSAVNQDGATAGFTVPNGRAQEALIRRVLAQARINPSEIDYLEAHGTGTSLGDPIEVQAAARALGTGRPADRPLLLGSAKTNIGHLEAAAGVAGLIKTVLALRHGVIPPHLHFRTPNPHIPWADLPVAVAARGAPWPARGRPRLAGVSSFGASGTNAHLVLQEAPGNASGSVASAERPLHMLALSARTPEALRQLANRFADYLTEHPESSLADVCFSANTGRAHFPVRLAVTAATSGEAAERLHALSSEIGAAATGGDPPKVAFLFSGQGSQYVGMGRGLYETQPAFRRTLDRCGDILRDSIDRPLAEVLYSPVNTWLDDTAYTQLALFALEYALFELWKSWGVQPAAVMGHSVGEYAAACAAGVFSLEEGLWLIAQRGRLMARQPAGGAMAAVAAGIDTVLDAIAGHRDEISVAAENAADQTVISGTGAAIQSVVEALEASGISSSRLRVSHAFHSALMDPMLAEFEQLAGQVRFRVPDLPLVSNVTGNAATEEVATASYWVRHARQPVRFEAGIGALRRMGCDAFVEAGPARTLLSLGRQSVPDPDVLWLPSLQTEGDDWTALLESLGRLYVRGARIDWRRFDQDHARSRLSLPTYPWQRESYWGPRRTSEPSPAASTALKDEDLIYRLEWRPQQAAVKPTRADYWPEPGDIAGRVRPLLSGLAPADADDAYRRTLARLEDLSIDYVAEAWERLGWNFRTGTRCSTRDLAERLGVAARHGKLLDRTADMLAEAELLRRHGDHWESAASFESGDPGTQMNLLLSRCPAAEAECRLLDRCAGALADVLRGDRDPLELLFPQGDATDASRLYRDAPGARLMNAILRAAIVQALDRLPAGRKLRVLEIGAGTGGTTAGLLEVLPPDRTDYLFTDISPRFTTAARAQFGGYGFVSYRTLDIERDPADQGFTGEAGFDLIVAANVLHATRDLRRSLAHVRKLASPGALLVLLEGTAPIRSVDLVFGLTEGWWRFSGDEVRASYPLISPAEWTSVLERAGFRNADAVAPDAGAWGVLSRNAVILARAADVVPEPMHWVILADRGGIGGRLADQHHGRGGTSTVIHPEQGLSGLRNLVGPVEVIDLWSLDEPPLEGTPDPIRPSCCGSVMKLVQSLVDESGSLAVARTWLVTQGAVSGSPAMPVPGLAQSPLWGLGRVIANEHPELRIARIDLDPDAGIEDRARMLWDELCSGSDEDEVSFRAAERRVQRLVRHASGGPAAPIRFRNDATYLITGGLGGLGLLTARWLVSRGAGTLVLAGRRAPDLLAEQACQALEAMGARIVIRQADVAHRQDVERLLAEIDRSLPPLRGVVHAAGVLDDGMVRNLTWERFARVLGPKQAGAWHLHDLTTTCALDFFVLYSSFTAVLGTPGQGNHAAANAFLDALAWHRRALGLPALSIGWGAWAEIGAAAERRVGERLRAKGARMMNPEQGLRLLEQVWHAEPAHVTVAPIQWEQLEGRHLSHPLLADFARPTPPAAGTTPDFLERWRTAAPHRRRSMLVDHIITETATVLGIKDTDAMEPTQGFFQLGMDSLTSVELRNRLRASLRCELPTTVAFDHPSPDALAAFVLGRIEPAPVAPAPALTLKEIADLGDLSVAELETLIDELAGSA